MVTSARVPQYPTIPNTDWALLWGSKGVRIGGREGGGDERGGEVDEGGFGACTERVQDVECRVTVVRCQWE